MSRVIAYTVMLAYFGTLAVIAVHECRHVFAAIAQGLQ